MIPKLTHLALILWVQALMALPLLAADHDPYLSPAELKAITEGLQKPTIGSVDDLNDLRGIRAAHVKRTQKDCDRALAAMSTSFDSFYGSLFSRSQMRLLDDLMRKVRIVDEPVWMLKNSQNRVRPHLRKTGVKLCPGVPKNYNAGTSYPSGHSALGYLQGLVLAKMFPDRQDEIMRRAREIGNDRIVLGVHHPSDVEAGFEIARRTLAELEKKKAFQMDFQATRAKFAQSPGRRANRSHTSSAW